MPDPWTHVDRYHLTWHTPSADSSGSMPIGNGEVAANVWVEPSGDLLFYLARTDAWSENNRLLKLGRVRVSLSPAPWTPGEPFEQTLDLTNGEIRCTLGAAKLRVWIDAHHPVMHVEVDAATEIRVSATAELWRTERRTITNEKEKHSAYGLHIQDEPIVVEPDTVPPPRDGHVLWCHRNERSHYPDNLRTQGLADRLEQSTDPLLHRTFGAAMRGPGFSPRGERELVSDEPRTQHRLSVTTHTAITDSLEQWVEQVLAIDSPDAEQGRDAHRKWWHAFWQRSYIHATGCPEAELVSRGYAHQRYLNACAGRGRFPIKFNGSLFTVDARQLDWEASLGLGHPQPTADNPAMDAGRTLDADYRRWGGPYWHQNTRLPYYTMAAAGDADMMLPLFRMYLDALPLARYRTRQYFGHGGSYFPETMPFWGTYPSSCYDHPTDHPDRPWCNNPYIRHHIAGMLEVVVAMLDCIEHGGELDPADALDFADAVITFYFEHYPRNEQGRLRIEPAQSLETYWDVVNPAPDIAGLHHLLPRLLERGDVEPTQRERWTGYHEKLPPLPKHEIDGVTYLVPADRFGDGKNIENPELYAVFPFGLYRVGKPDLDLARRTFGKRVNQRVGGWMQDGIQAAMLGLTGLAESYTVEAFGKTHPASRFPGFAGPNFDWIPDGDHTSCAMISLQKMVLQEANGELQILPAWPEDWSVQFKLHVPGQIVTGDYQPGREMQLQREASTSS